VRSRLTVYALPTNVREIVDEVVRPILPQKQTVKKPPAEVIPEYERLYELPVKPLDTDNAEAIERASWNTTRRLVEAFEDGSEEEPAPIPEPKAPTVTAPPPPAVPSASPSGLVARLSPYRSFLLARSEREQNEVARSMGKMPDAVADEINEIAVEELEDVLLVAGENGYEIPEDYRSLLEGL